MKGVATCARLAVAASLLISLDVGPAGAQPLPEIKSCCLSCHADKDLSMTLKDRFQMSL